MSERTDDLKIRVSVPGADQGAKDLEGVADAQAKVTGKVEDAGSKASKAAAETKKLAASESDVVEILRQVSPALGGLVDSMLKGGRVAGDLASQNITLTGAFQKLSGAVKANASAFKLLLAGGAVVAGVMAIMHAVRQLRQEHEKATAAAKAHADALNELFRERQERQQAIEDISDARKRIGGFDAQRSRRAVSLAESISQQYEQLSPDAVNYAVGHLADLGLTRPQLVTASVLRHLDELSFNPAQSGDTMHRVYTRSFKRNAEAVREWMERERTQGQGLGWGGERLERAKVQRTGTAETIDIEQLVKPFVPGGMDAQKIAGLIQRFGSVGTLEAWERGVDPTTGKRTQVSKGTLPGGLSLGDLFKPMSSVAGSEDERAIVRSLLERFANVEGALKENTAAHQEAAKAIMEGGGVFGRQPTVHNDNRQYGVRNYGPDAASNKARQDNGETRLTRMENF